MLELNLFVTLLAAIPVLVAIWIFKLMKDNEEKKKLIPSLRGPEPVLPYFGNSLYIGIGTGTIFKQTKEMTLKYGSPCRFFLGSDMYVGISDPENLELVMGNNKLLDKGSSYYYFTPWIGYGLLTSTGARWRKHRKLITPTFHFKILEEFVDTFDSNSNILMEKLKPLADGTSFNIHPLIALCALDIIAETAMGVPIYAQSDENSEYVNAVNNLTRIIMYRMFKPWYGKYIFPFLPNYKIYNHSLKVTHDKITEVLKIKRAEQKNKVKTEEKKEEEFGSKKKLAFLDMLLESQIKDPTFTDEDIRQETDTFMFEGYDTTTSGSGFCIHLIAKSPEVQEKIVEELDSIFQGSDRPVTYKDLTEMNYLDRVIKEAQRIRGSVPFIFRLTNEEVRLKNGEIIPKGTNISMMLHSAHHDPKIWPEPHVFNPDRFLPENLRDRHTYAYVPFSAGPRNCIGQKYAVLEMKSLISKLLRNYKLIDVGHEPDLRSESVLKSANGICIGLLPRNP